MNKYSVSAQYVGLFLISEICRLVLSLLELAFPQLAGGLAITIAGIPLVGLYFYSLIILAERFGDVSPRFGNVFIVAMACYVANAVLAPVILFTSNDGANIGLSVFIYAIDRVLFTCATFFVLTGFKKIAENIEAGFSKMTGNVGYAVIAVHSMKTLLTILSLSSIFIKLLQVTAIITDILILHLCHSLYKTMRSYHERRAR